MAASASSGIRIRPTGVSSQTRVMYDRSKSMKAMGADGVKTVVISGEGWDGCVGQQWDPNSPNWRKFANKGYVRSIEIDEGHGRGWRKNRCDLGRRLGWLRRPAVGSEFAQLA